MLAKPHSAKAKAEQGSVALCSMDDEALYGKELFVINFSEAVQRGLLTDKDNPKLPRLHVLLVAGAQRTEHPVGMQVARVETPDGPVAVAIWYPTSARAWPTTSP